MSDLIHTTEPNPLSKIPTPLNDDGEPILNESELLLLEPILNDFVNSETQTLLQISGNLTLFKNASYQEKLGSYLYFKDLNEMLVSLLAKNNMIAEDIINVVYQGNIVKNLTVEIIPGEPSDVYCNIYPVIVGERVVGSRFELFESTENEIELLRKVDKLEEEARRREELNDLLREKAKANSYSFVVDPSTLTFQDLLSMFLSPKASQALLDDARNIDLWKDSIIPQDPEAFAREVIKHIKSFLNKRKSEPLSTSIIITGLTVDGEEKKLRNDLTIENSGNGQIKLHGCLVDVSDDFEQARFHRVMADTIVNVTSIGDYGEQLRLIVAESRAILPDVSGISVARPKAEKGADGKRDYTFDIKEKLDDSIRDFEDETQGLKQVTYSILDAAFNSPGPYVIDDYAEASLESFIIYNHQGVRSLVSIPIRVNGETVALMNFSSTKPYAFSQTQIDELEVLSRFLAISIEREAFVGELQRAVTDAIAEIAKLLKDLETTSHDLKTPMTVITTQAYLLGRVLQQNNVAPNLYERYLNLISTSAHNTSAQLDQALNQIKQRTSISEQLSMSNLREIIREVNDAVDSLSFERKNDGTETNIKLNFVPGNIPDNFVFLTKRSGFKRALQNLIGNAIKYSKDGELGIINIYSNIFDNNLEIRIEDNGIGIPEEDRVRIFEGERADNVGDREGHGVGLNFVRDFIESLNGTVVLKTSIRGGSEFVIRVPLKERGGFLGFDTKETQEA